MLPSSCRTLAVKTAGLPVTETAMLTLKCCCCLLPGWLQCLAVSTPRGIELRGFGVKVGGREGGSKGDKDVRSAAST